MLKAPSFNEVNEKFLQLTNGEYTREEIAAWANKWIREEIPNVENNAVWNALVVMASADLRPSPDQYLYSIDDIKAWYKKFQDI